MAAFVLVGALLHSRTATAQNTFWQPRPQPRIESLYEWEPVSTDLDPGRLQPGETLTVRAERLDVMRVQFEPAYLEAYLEFSYGFDADGKRRASTAAESIRQGKGDLLVWTDMHRRVPVRVRLSEDAPEAARMTIQRARSSDARFFWIWWSEQLYDWLESRAGGAPPEGLPIVEQQGVLQAAGLASTLIDLSERLGASDRVRKAALHLAAVILIRAIEERRSPEFAYYRRRELFDALPDTLPVSRVRAGSRDLGEGRRLSADRPWTFEIEGPAQIHLGLRAVKESGNPDARTDYALRVVERGEAVHRDTFSSRAASYEVEQDAQSDAQADDEASSGDASTEQNPASAENDDTALVARAEPRRAQARDQSGNILGWRRRTRWWIPPGRHTYELHVSGADVVVDGMLATPRRLAQDLLQHRWDANWHLEQVDELLRGSESRAATFLRIERASVVDRRASVREAIERHAEDLSEKGGAAVEAWLEWRRLEAIPEDVIDFEVLEAERVSRILSSKNVPDELQRVFSFAVTRRLIQTSQPVRARALVRRLSLEDDTLDQSIWRSRAETEAGNDPWERWQGIAQLYRTWQLRPTSRGLERALQRAWWHKSYWRDLAPSAGERGRVDFMEPIDSETGELYVRELETMGRVWYRIDPDKPHVFRIDHAPDIPTRLARVRMKFTGDRRPGWRSLRWNDRPISVLRTSSRQEVDFAVEPKTQYEIALADTRASAEGAADSSGDAAASEVFIDQPPIRTLSIAETAATRERAYWLAADDRPREWRLQGRGMPRWIRVSIRGVDGTLEETVRCDFGNGEVRYVDVAWSPSEDASVHKPVEFVLQVPSAAGRVSIEPDESRVHVALEMRAGKLPDIDDNRRIDVPVDLPADRERIDQIRVISERIQSAKGLGLAEARVTRAKILMSLAQNRLARVDLEYVMEMLPTTHPLFEHARLLRRSVLDRLSDDWLELDEKWLGNKSVLPLDLAAQVVAKAETELARCRDAVARVVGPTRAPVSELLSTEKTGAESGCRRAALVLALDTPDAAGDPVALLRELVEAFPVHGFGAWEAQSRLARALWLRANREGDSRLVTEAYGHARDAAGEFPYGPVRAAWYDALSATRWESLSVMSGGVRQVFPTFEPWQDPQNVAEFDMPVIDDAAEDAIEFAMLGVNWPEQHRLRMYGDFRRTIHFRAQATGELSLEHRCSDIRPYLQEPGAEPCRVSAVLHRDDGATIERTAAERTEGGVQISRWPLLEGREYKLVAHRRDEVSGRRSFIYAHATTADGEQRPVVRRRTRRLTVIDSTTPAGAAVLGPTYLRVDARGLAQLPAGSVKIVATHIDSGETLERELEVSGERQSGAWLDGKALTHARRGEWWLRREGPWRIRLETSMGLALIRVSLRQADPDRPRRTGAASAEATAEEADAGPTVRSSRFDVDLARQAVEAPRIAEFGRGDLLAKRGPWPTTRLRVEWQADDVELTRESGDPSGTRDFFETTASAIYGFRPEGLWVAGTAGARTDFASPPVLQLSTEADWRPEFWRLRVQPELQMYYQRRGRSFISGRGQLRVGRSFGLAPDLWVIPSVRGTVRLQQSGAPSRANGPLSARVYSEYSEAHPLTTDVLPLLWWKPFLNFIGYGYIQPTLNPDFSLDKLRARVSGRLLFDTVRLETGYRLTWYADDSWRSAAFWRHDIDVEGRLYYWASRGHFLELDAFTQTSLYDFESGGDVQFTAGLALSYTFSRDRGLADLPPTDLTFEEFLAPHYFGSDR